MRASCCICQEIFTSGAELSATPCGHVFHAECLRPWFTRNHSCPQCREKVSMRNMIAKLFLTEMELEDNELDSGKLKNDLDEMRVKVREKDKSIKELQADHKKQQERIDALRESVSSLQGIYKLEVTKNSTLKKEVLGYKAQRKDADRAMDEAKQLRAKLKQLQNLDTLRNGLMSDIEERALNANTRDLAEWVVIQDKEMKRKRNECRTYQEEIIKLKKECRSFRAQSEAKIKDLTVLEEKLRLSEEDVKNIDAQNKSLKKKLEALQNSISSPSGVGSSLAYRLIHESPAPMPPSKRPRLSEPPGFDLNESAADMFASSGEESRCEKNNTSSITKKNSCQEFGTKYVKISSASSSFKEKAKDTAKENNVSNVPAIGAFNILQRKQGSGLMPRNSTAIRTGYNGLGGHSKFIQPKGFTKPQNNAKKGLLARSTKPMFTPPLPSLNL